MVIDLNAPTISPTVGATLVVALDLVDPTVAPDLVVLFPFWAGILAWIGAGLIPAQPYVCPARTTTRSEFFCPNFYGSSVGFKSFHTGKLGYVVNAGSGDFFRIVNDARFSEKGVNSKG